MNPGEEICVSESAHISCVQNFSQPVNIFDFDGSQNKSCNLFIPENFSVFIESFLLGSSKAPENFVLFNGEQEDFKLNLN